MLKEQFKQADTSWNEPSKEGLQKIIDLLAQEAKNMRDDHTIQSNYNKINRMIQRCDCKGKQRPVPKIATENTSEPEQAAQSSHIDKQAGQSNNNKEQEPDIDESDEPSAQMCPYLDKCPIFLNNVKNNSENIIARMWCTSEDLYMKCMRKQLKDAGKHVPKNMMPTGKLL